MKVCDVGARETRQLVTLVPHINIPLCSLAYVMFYFLGSDSTFQTLNTACGIGARDQNSLEY